MTDTTSIQQAAPTAPPRTGTGLVLPLYLAGDVSGSMLGSPLDQVNALMPQLMTTIHTNGTLAELAYLSVVEFSSSASTLLPLGPVSAAPGVPHFAGGGGTNYTSVFELLAQQIETDVAALKAAGKQVYRPAVFFYSDGEPTVPEQDWKDAFSRLADPAEGRIHANFIPFGIGSASRQTIEFLSRPQGYVQDANAGYDLPAAMNVIITVIMHSLLRSANSMQQGGGMLLPNNVPGFTTVAANVVA